MTVSVERPLRVHSCRDSVVGLAAARTLLITEHVPTSPLENTHPPQPPTSTALPSDLNMTAERKRFDGLQGFIFLKLF